MYEFSNFGYSKLYYELLKCSLIDLKQVLYWIQISHQKSNYWVIKQVYKVDEENVLLTKQKAKYTSA